MYSNSGFFSHTEEIKVENLVGKPLEKHVMQHKQALWDLPCGSKINSDIQRKVRLIFRDVERRTKWLLASFAFPHIDMRAGIASMNSKWINEYLRKCSRYPVLSFDGLGENRSRTFYSFPASA